MTRRIIRHAILRCDGTMRLALPALRDPVAAVATFGEGDVS